jgi:hypothetical protein
MKGRCQLFIVRNPNLNEISVTHRTTCVKTPATSHEKGKKDGLWLRSTQNIRDACDTDFIQFYTNKWHMR